MGNNVLTKVSGGPAAWDAAARSLAGLRGDGSFFFKIVQGSFSVAVGLQGPAPAVGYVDLAHAIYVSEGGSPSVLESGADRGIFGAVTTLSTEYEIRRVGTVVTYRQDGALLYTSAVPSSGDVWLGVRLVGIGDGVQDPRVEPGVGGSVFLDDLTVSDDAITGQAIGTARITPREVLALTISGRAAGAATITPQEILRAAVRGIAVGGASFSATEDGAVSLSLVGVGRGSIRPVGVDHETWAMNLDTGSVTFYEGFSFNSFAKIGANYFGCKADGIYQLDGDTDAGAPIRSMVSFGKQNFGTSALKRVTNAYVGVSGQGRLFLKVLAEGREYTYAQRGYDEQLQVQRFDTGKGLRVNWLEFELYNADGEDFELASVEFAAVPLSRRI